jgi:hypothetical protein
VAPNYERPAFVASNFKPQRGALVLKREDDAAEAAKIEKREKAKARKRDGRCRWPEPHKCRFALESAHIKHASTGGAMASENLVTLCGWLHRRGPETQQYGQLRIEKDTAAGADGPLSFWRQNLDGNGYYLVARERAPFVIEKD